MGERKGEAAQSGRAERVLRDGEPRPASSADDTGFLTAGQKQILEMVATGAPLTEVLTGVIRLIEGQTEGVRGSILVRRPDSDRFHMGVAPSLPGSYTEALRQAPIPPPYPGPCARATHLGEEVVTADIATDPRWSEQWRDLVLGHDLHACYSSPILASDGTVLGSFGIYHREPRDPRPRDPRLIEVATHLAGIAIERKETEDAHREFVGEVARRSRVFDTTLSSIADFAYTFDRDGRFLYVNKPLLDLWGLKLEDAVGKNFFELPYPPDLAARLQRQIEHVFETRQRLSDETPYTSPAGVEGYYEYILSPVLDADGNVDAVAGSTRDITERKRTEQALRESEARLRTLSRSLERHVDERTARLRRLANKLASAERRERRQLAAILHDDLQQLLVAAKMRLGQARRKMHDPAVASEIDGAADLLGQAMDSGRDLTRQLRPPNLYEDGLVSALRWLASELARLHDLHVAIDAEDAEILLGDDINALLFESIRELLFNVVKHAGVSESTVRLRQDQQRLRIDVEDKGDGFIYADEQDSEQSPQRPGIGLFSIRERLIALGGDIAVETLTEGGTRVRLTLPVSAGGD